ncbi:hypothetical protein K0M31_013847 [Melipona bicolor]|uniref:Uncharacterized protein n=1 Tax=Melipona bicolor TaxID=60889 RepID=A0AA40G7M5_9HYME|nr:hypothetical protein K0M31_013847 [Melipona bicolor]
MEESQLHRYAKSPNKTRFSPLESDSGNGDAMRPMAALYTPEHTIMWYSYAQPTQNSSL